ncbi:hypothetical protein [Planomonospora sp. ID82291]|uniref:hypothetical protein n=1 Tax=Planomonospora sp. ID82291 TaxID=2738136 RepID=UPI0018C42752|nr:hypothetical protein [Planomonospora sp. ID82291]MBG0815125.1 hypothetical protein [Planomonospora sp. ID82291]
MGPASEPEPVSGRTPAPEPPAVPGGGTVPGPPAVPREEARGREPGRQDDVEPVRRVGRPPGGRPARPDLLVAQGPPRRGPGGGRHRPAVAPSAARRSSPKRGRGGRGLVVPLVLVLVLTAAAGGGLALWGWVRDSLGTGLRLAGGDFQPADGTFASPADGGGDGSSQVLNAIAAVGPTVVAVGSDTTSPVPRPLFLVSPDGGTTWRLGKVTGFTGQEGGPTTVGLVAGGDGRWLAAGNEPSGAGRPAGGRTVGLWTSVDGHRWSAVDAEGLTAFTGGDRITDLARTSSGFVVVGTTVLGDGTLGAVAWTSPDGRSWTRVETRDIGTPDRVRGLRAVAARGNAVVALADPAQGGSGSVVLRSGDGGRSWLSSGVALDGVLPQPGTLAVAGKGFVLVPLQQRSAKGEVRVHCSDDGGKWEACGAITGLDAQGSGVKRLTSSPDGVAAVTETDLERYAVHTSADGREWSRAADLGRRPGSLRALAVSGTGTLVVGGDERAAEVDNRLVLITAAEGGEAKAVPLTEIRGLVRAARETARVAAGEGRFVAVGSVFGDAGIWSSTDGEEWRAAGSAQILGGAHRQALGDVVYGRRGWLAVGTAMSGASSTEPLLVTSADGGDWRRVPAADALKPAGDRDFLAPHAVAAGPSGYVLAGEERGAATAAPVLWFSADLKRFTRAADLPAGGAGVRLHDVSPTSSGYMAVGGSGTAGHETGVVWVSADGVAWTARRPVLPVGATSAGLRHVVTYGGQAVAIGAAETPDGDRAFGAVSRDNGATWETVWLPADRTAAVHDLAATPDGVVAVGRQGAPGEGDSAVWTSPDGRSWQPHTPTQGHLAGGGVQWLGAVAVSGGQVVALGRSTTYDADHLTLWRSTLTADR